LAESGQYEFDVPGLADGESGSGHLIGGHRAARVARATAVLELLRSCSARITQIWARALRRPGLLIGAGCVFAVALAAATTLIGATDPIVNPAAQFLTLRALFCVGLVVVALVLLARGATPRMPALFVGLACAMALAGFAGADARVVFSLGRIAIPGTVALTTYVSLAYPSGWIEDRLASLVWRTTTVVLLVLAALNLLISQVPPVAGPFIRCSGGNCPSNPLNVVDIGSGPGRALSTMLAVITGLSLVLVAALVARRWVTSTRLQRRSLAPLLAWCAAAALGYGLFVTVRAIDTGASALTPAAVVVAAIIGAMPFAILLGLIRGSVFAMSALEQMIGQLGEQSSLRGLQQVVSRAFADPTLRLLTWHPEAQRYVDVDGQSVDVSAPERRGKLTRLCRERDMVAAVIHDPFLSNDVLEAAGSAVRLALDNTRLQTDLSASIKELEASRKRVASAADEERRRIEQDLHDGAQQGLIALRIKLQLLQELAAEDPEAIAPALADAGARVDATLDSIRNLAKGIYPSVLRDLGLAYALATVIRELPVRVVLRSELGQRYEPEVETAVYFCCVEALQNVAKHCGSDSRAGLLLSEHEYGLQFLLTDNGPGFDPARSTGTSGITGMRDRLEAIGGQLTIASIPGRGTTITGRIPSDVL
jgi:signal transduction histidine kinase